MISRRWITPALALLPFVVPSSPLLAQVRVEKNVVYGMVSGLALLMDVHHPAEPNGYGLMWIWGSGWHAPPEYGSWQLKDWALPQIYLDAGYTVFAINHREASLFHYPEVVEDVQRAVRFIRYHAAEYGVDPDRLAGWGGSSGGHLVNMLATLDGTGDADDPDPVNRESSKLQLVVSRAGPTALWDFEGGSIQHVASFMGGIPDGPTWVRAYREASPITHVTSDDPPMLLIHGDADAVVPFAQSEQFARALRDAGVDVDLIRVEGGDHGANDMPTTLRWLDTRLMGGRRAADDEPLVAGHERLLAVPRLGAAGDITGALSVTVEARAMDDRLTVPADIWLSLCWNGAVWDRAAEVLSACEQGSEAMRVQGRSGWMHQAHGIARALTGDRAGAIEELEAFLTSPVRNQRARAWAREWIAELRAGRNPFTPEVLETLRSP